MAHLGLAAGGLSWGRRVIDVVSRCFTDNLNAWPAPLPLPSPPGSDRVRVVPGDPWPGLMLRDGAHWLAMHSRRDPIRDAARTLEPIDASSTSTIFVIGLGLGYILDVLEQQRWTGRVVAFEPEPAVAGALLNRRDWRDWLTPGRLAILLGPDYDGLDQVVPSLDPNRPDPVIIVNPVIGRLHAALTEATVRRAARAWFGARANQEARRQNGGRYLLNTLRNAPAIAALADAAALSGRFTGVPAIVVAAGPSLDRNLAEIIRYRERALVIAVDTALRPLLGAGVHPDLAVAVDPSEANARHLVDLPACPETHLVAEGSLDPEAVRHFAGRAFVFRVADHHPWPWLRGLGLDRGRLRAWGSVLTTAFDLALGMGCDPIVFTGADLAFTDGQPYARGTTYEEDWRREQSWGQTLDESWAARVGEWPETTEAGVDEAPARTAPHLRSFRDWLVAEAGKAAGRTIINATGRGILVGAGIRQGTVAEALEARAALPRDVRESIAALHGERPESIASAWERDL